MLRPSWRYALHPYLPRRLGFRHLLARTEPRLASLLDISDPYTLISPRNRTTIYRAAQEALQAGIPGDFVEIGVHRGGSAAVIAGLLQNCSDRRLHLFDRWGDLPETSESDGFRQEEYARVNIADKLDDLVRNPPLNSAREVIEGKVGFERAIYWQGWFHETFPRYDGQPIAFASVDCDYYESVKYTLDFVREHSSSGCCVVIDDYDPWPGAKLATDEFAARHGLRVERTWLGPAILRLP